MFLFPMLFGYFIFADGGIQQAIIRQRRTSLVVAVVGTGISIIIPVGLEQWGWKFSLPSFVLVMSMANLLIWSYLLTAFGYGMRYLTYGNRMLAYANEAVLPFYILHQPVILILGYFIIPLSLPILAKYMIITPLAFGISLGIYEFGIRRVNLVRRAFGLKAQKQELPAPNLAIQPQS